MEDQVDIAYHMPFLEAWASKAAIVVELGCGHGNGSTRAFARGLERSDAPNKLFISVDQDSRRPDLIPMLPYWHIIHGPSESGETVARVLPLLKGQHANIIFVDTHHTYDQLKKELRVWQPLVGHGTIWLFHDTHMFGVPNEMVDAIHEYVKEHPGWEYIEVTKESHGMGMLRRTV